MKQSKQAEEMIELMNLTDRLAKKGVLQSEEAPKASGPGASARTTPNDYTQDEVVKMLDYAKQFVSKGKAPQSWKTGEQNWLNLVGKGMEEFTGLRKGDPSLDYKEGTHGDDAHDKPYSAISFKKADKGKIDQDMKSSGPGSRKDAPEVTDISRKDQSISFGKADKGNRKE